MLLNERIKAFSELGTFLSQFKLTEYQTIKNLNLNTFFYDEFIQKIENAEHHNGWFTKENMLFAITQWSEALSEENLKQWLSHYTIEDNNPKTIGVIMAGNIPLVGFHDFLSVLISGHSIIIKQSSNDANLLPLITKILCTISPGLKQKITFTQGKMENYDAIIATGSDNTARYFDYYFKRVPSIIRKNRNSIAVLKGDETIEELQKLGEDIFRYYGLGCRSVSKLFVPKGYNFDLFFKAIYTYSDIINGTKYANNYDYNKAVYLMSNYKLLENGFLMLKEDKSYSSPIATLFYETYEDLELLKERLAHDDEKIQCIIGNNISIKEINFGQSQTPKLDDYADDINTIEFLAKIN